MNDRFHYDALVDDALRSVVRRVLTQVAEKGLPGSHHFYISFRSGDPGVMLPDYLRAKYPEEMTIVLQHQFWDLKVSEGHFEVGLSFGGVPENLLVPFDAIKSFFDPSIQFGLQFETIAEGAQADAAAAKPEIKDQKGTRLPARHDPIPASLPQTAPATEPDPGIPSADDAGNQSDKPAAQVVHLDRFRKK